MSFKSFSTAKHEPSNQKAGAAPAEKAADTDSANKPVAPAASAVPDKSDSAPKT